ncbi:MAG: hypothetical protein KAT05_17545, partial [Spirochaetes bacterium]|nr:hypothetical protein [Spirochaetota bacterium]
YGSKQWKDEFSSFEKLVLPLMMGGAVYYLITIPISAFLTILKVFRNDVTQINLLSHTETIFYIVLLYLAIWRLVFSNCSLKENNNFFNITKYLIIATIGTISIANFILLLAFIFSDYLDFLIYIILSYVLLFLLVVLYSFFLEFYGQKIILKPQEIDDFFIDLKWKSGRLKDIISKKKTNINRWLFIILIVVLIAAPIGGNYLLKTNVQMVDEKNISLEIPIIQTWEYRKNITGDLEVEQNHSITFKLIPWKKFKPNISLVPPEKSYCIDPNLNGEYLTINGSSWSTTNVILCGKKPENNLPRIYEIKKENLNDTFQKWEIKFNNPYPYNIHINEFDIEKDKQFKFINYSINNLLFTGRYIDQLETIGFTGLVIWYKGRYSNQSITLLFEKKNTLT